MKATTGTFFVGNIEYITARAEPGVPCYLANAAFGPIFGLARTYVCDEQPY